MSGQIESPDHDGALAPPVFNPFIEGLPAVSTHLQLPGVTGGSTAKGHEGWIEVHSFAWGVSPGPLFRDGSGSGRPRRLGATLSPLVVRTVVDVSGPELFRAVTTGRGLASALLEVATVGRPVSYQYEFKDILISSYRIASVATTPVQVFEIEAERVTFTYRTMAEDGSAGDEVSVSWDVHVEH